MAPTSHIPDPPDREPGRRPFPPGGTAEPPGNPPGVPEVPGSAGAVPDPTGPPTHLPNEGTDAYVGLPEADARRRAAERGWSTVRVLPPDAVITMEYIAGRLNLAVEAGRVVRAWEG
ncbi:I78 family peptidase inhibitor [Streptomyces sp. ST2-7A]|uniref:I78 family peptidase inhibitor n=1 Tax=Streptomyces sp. ST2-7A TaxID=2907214 RepID=UPI0035ABB106